MKQLINDVDYYVHNKRYATLIKLLRPDSLIDKFNEDDKKDKKNTKRKELDLNKFNNVNKVCNLELFNFIEKAKIGFLDKFRHIIDKKDFGIESYLKYYKNNKHINLDSSSELPSTASRPTSHISKSVDREINKPITKVKPLNLKSLDNKKDVEGNKEVTNSKFGNKYSDNIVIRDEFKQEKQNYVENISSDIISSNIKTDNVESSSGKESYNDEMSKENNEEIDNNDIDNVKNTISNPIIVSETDITKKLVITEDLAKLYQNKESLLENIRKRNIHYTNTVKRKKYYKFINLIIVL